MPNARRNKIQILHSISSIFRKGWRLQDQSDRRGLEEMKSNYSIQERLVWATESGMVSVLIKSFPPVHSSTILWCESVARWPTVITTTASRVHHADVRRSTQVPLSYIGAQTEYGSHASTTASYALDINGYINWQTHRQSNSRQAPKRSGAKTFLNRVANYAQKFILTKISRDWRRKRSIYRSNHP